MDVVNLSVSLSLPPAVLWPAGAAPPHFMSSPIHNIIHCHQFLKALSSPFTTKSRARHNVSWQRVDLGVPRTLSSNQAALHSIKACCMLWQCTEEGPGDWTLAFGWTFTDQGPPSSWRRSRGRFWNCEDHSIYPAAGVTSCQNHHNQKARQDASAPSDGNIVAFDGRQKLGLLSEQLLEVNLWIIDCPRELQQSCMRIMHLFDIHLDHLHANLTQPCMPNRTSG